MFTALLNSSLIHGAIPITIGALSLVALGAVVSRRPARRWSITFVVAGVAGACLGFAIAWYLGDVRDDFGVTLALSTRAWLAIGVAGIAVAGVSLWRARRWRVPVGIASIVLFALLAAVGVNATVGEFPTVGDALGSDGVRPLTLSNRPPSVHPSVSAKPLWQSWRGPTNLARTGTVGTVKIPATVSHFSARRAVVYLPPAAIATNAPRLPVLIFLGGQPGSPQTVLSAGQLPEIVDAFADAHHGLAPIVVIPDQLGTPGANPMCLDSPLGKVATYLTVDVPTWIKSHLGVLSGPRNWAIAGFSEGGTCSIQLGTKYRSLFGNILDISGQSAPLNGSVVHTIKVGFGGSTVAYDAASATSLLAAGAPFSTTLGIFVVGQNDTKYGQQSVVVERAARAAHMQVKSFLSPGTAHDWYTEQYGLRVGLPLLAERWGLGR